MSIITQDALKLISEHLSPTSRLNLAAIDQRFFEVATKWHDVKTILFDDDDVTMAGPNFVHTFENSAFEKRNSEENVSFFKTDAKETSLKLCPGIKKLIIQTKLVDFDAVMLNKLNLKLTKLYISTENLSLINFPKFPKLRTLHLVMNSTKELKVVELIEQRVLDAVFPQSLTRVCLTGIFLTECLLVHLSKLKNLVCLDLIGCLVDTRVGAKYVPLFEKFELLDELSLPASLFSFSTKAKTTVDFNLQNLKVSKLGIYMDQFDEDQFYSQTCKFLPKKLKYLVVFGNYLPLKKWKQLSSIKNFGIIFGPNTPLASCPQANLTNVKLLSHFVRSPPYIQQEHNPNFLRNHDVIIGNLSWQFSLFEWKDTNGSKKEVMALRRRLNAADDEEVLFEGVRIPAPVIIERFGQLRERRAMMPLPAGSPNDFQVFDNNIPMAPPLPPALPPPARRRHDRSRSFSRQVAASASRRRNRSAPPTTTTTTQRQSDSMRTNPPSPPGTRTGAVFNATLPYISPIGATTASQVGGTVSTVPSLNVSTATDVMNRGFIGTPATPGTSSASTLGSSESRRLSTASQISSVVNSEMTVPTTATASPERLTQGSQAPAADLRAPPPPQADNVQNRPNQEN